MFFIYPARVVKF